MPIITDKAPAPSEMLRKICCVCKSVNRLCTACTCFKKSATKQHILQMWRTMLSHSFILHIGNTSEFNQTSGLHFTQVHCVSLLHHAWCACPVAQSITCPIAYSCIMTVQWGSQYITNVRTAALLPMNANNESVRFAKQGTLKDFQSKLITLI